MANKVLDACLEPFWVDLALGLKEIPESIPEYMRKNIESFDKIHRESLRLILRYSSANDWLGWSINFNLGSETSLEWKNWLVAISAGDLKTLFTKFFPGISFDIKISPPVGWRVYVPPANDGEKFDAHHLLVRGAASELFIGVCEYWLDQMLMKGVKLLATNEHWQNAF